MKPLYGESIADILLIETTEYITNNTILKYIAV